MTSEIKNRSVIKTILTGLLVVVCIPLAMLAVLWLAYEGSAANAQFADPPPQGQEPSIPGNYQSRTPLSYIDPFEASSSTGPRQSLADNQARDTMGGGYSRNNQAASQNPYAESGQNRSTAAPASNLTNPGVRHPYQDPSTGFDDYGTRLPVMETQPTNYNRMKVPPPPHSILPARR